jgi:hypothetical protein
MPTVRDEAGITGSHAPAGRSGADVAGFGAGCLVGCRATVGRGSWVLDGADVVEVAASVGGRRSTMYRWVGRYLAGYGTDVACFRDTAARPPHATHFS